MPDKFGYGFLLVIFALFTFTQVIKAIHNPTLGSIAEIVFLSCSCLVLLILMVRRGDRPDQPK
jgi:hypothetical protein